MLENLYPILIAIGIFIVFLSFSIRSRYIFSESADVFFLSSGRKKTFISRASAPASAMFLANPVHPSEEKQLMLGITGMLSNSLAFLTRLRYSSTEWDLRY